MHAGVVRPMETSGRWTLKRCDTCKRKRQMPINDRECGHCRYPEPKPQPPEPPVFLPGLKAARLRARLTQKELSKRVWLDRSTITSYERGRSPASPEVAHAIAFAVGVFLEELTEGQEIEVQSGATREVS